jgi:hypothetical protein
MKSLYFFCLLFTLSLSGVSFAQSDCQTQIETIQSTHFSEKLRIDEWRTETQRLLDLWKSERALRQAQGKLSPEEFQAWMDGVYTAEIKKINDSYNQKIWQNDRDRDQAMEYVYRACQSQ